MSAQHPSDQKIVAVLTASSNSGEACVHRLLKFKKGPIVRAIFRTEKKAAKLRAKYSSEARLQIHVGVDARDPPTLLTSLQSCTTVFIVTPHDPSRGFSDDATLTANMINASISVGIKHIILAGSWTVDAKDKVTSIASRFVQPESLLMNNDNIKYTILRGGYFYNNYLALLNSINQNDQTNEKVINSINFIVPANDPRDIGHCAAHCILDESNQHMNKIYEISGPSYLSLHDVMKTFSNQLNRQFKFNEITEKKGQSEYINKFPLAFKELLNYLLESGEKAVPISDHVLKITGSPPTRLDQWIQDHKHLVN